MNLRNCKDFFSDNFPRGIAAMPPLFSPHCQIVLLPNCLVLYYHGAKLPSTNCPVQIVLLPNCMVPNFPGAVCGLQGKFSVHTFFTQLIFCIFLLLILCNILPVHTS